MTAAHSYGIAFVRAARRLLAAFLLSSGATGAVAGPAPEIALEKWRSDIAATRRLLENDVVAAQREAERLYSSLPAEATAADRARALNLRSRSHLYLARSEAGAGLAESAFEIALAGDDKIGQAEAHLNIALNAIHQGTIGALREASTAALALLDGVDRPDLLGEAMLHTAIYRLDGQLEASVSLSMQTLDIAERSGDSVFLTYALQGMGISMEQSGRHAEAVEHFIRMEEQAGKAGSRLLMATSRLGLAAANLGQGRHQEAERHSNVAIALFRGIGAPFHVAHALVTRAEILHRQGRHAEALAVLDEAEKLYTRHPNRIGLWRTLYTRSMNHAALGQIERATADAGRAHALVRDLDFPLYVGESAAQLAALAARRGDYRQAYAFSTQAAEAIARGEQERTSQQMEELTERYRSEAKQRQIEELTRQAQRYALEQRSLWTVLGASVIVLAVAGWFLVRQRRSNRLLADLNARVEQSSRQLQATLGAIPHLLLEFGPEGRIHGYHSPHPDLLPLPPSEFLGRTVSELLPPESAASCMAALREAHEAGVSTGWLLSHETKDGALWVDLSVARKPGGNGHEERFIVLVRDVTKRKRAEEALQARERELRTLTENVPINIIRYDRQGRMTYVNPAIVRFLGTEPEALLGKKPLEGIVATTLEQWQGALAFANHLEIVLDTGELQEIEIPVPHVIQGMRIHSIRFAAERDDTGMIVGALAVGYDITERKAAEGRLHASEQAFRAVVENSPDSIARFDRMCRRVYVNPAGLRYFGRPAAEVLGTTPHDASPLPDAEHFVAQLRHVLDTGEEIAAEVPCRFADGEIRWGHLRLVPEHGPDGVVASVLAIIRDIDELKISEQRFRTLADNFPDLLVRFDSECCFTYVNPAVVRTFGMAPEAIIGTRLHDLGTPGDESLDGKLEAGIRLAFATGLPNQQEGCWQTERGEQVFEIRYVPEKDAAGRVTSVIGIKRNITLLRETELALRVSEREFRNLAENSPNLIMRYDRECRRTYVNPAYERERQLRRPQALAVTPDTDWRPDVSMPVERYKATLRQVMDSSTRAQLELGWTNQDTGEVGHYDVQIVPEYDQEGLVVGAMTIGHNVTALKLAESRLRASYDLLRQLASQRESAREQERKRIAREIHDELGQQLTALRLKVGLLSFQFGEQLPALHESTAALLSAVDQTIQLVRNVSASLRPASLDMGIVPALEWLAGEFERKMGIRCELGPMPSDLAVDEERSIVLFRIAQESLTNVARHALATLVRITLEQRDDVQVLEIEDDGVGFDPSKTCRQTFGLLGMRERALAVGGETTIEKVSGRGTRVRVIIPIRKTGDAP